MLPDPCDMLSASVSRVIENSRLPILLGIIKLGLQRTLASFTASSNAHPCLGVPPKGLSIHLHRRLRQFPNPYTVFPVGRADRDEPRVCTRASLKFRKTDGYECALLRNLVEIRDAFGLGVAVAQEPSFPFESRRRVRVERFVSVKQNFSFDMKKLQR